MSRNAHTTVSVDSMPKEGQYPGFVCLEGENYPPQVRDDMPDNVRAFEVRDNDVFIVTYSKAGTHWMTEIVKNILTDGDYEKAEKQFGIHPKPLEYFTTVTDIAKKPRDQQRVIVAHLHKELIPQDIFKGKAKVVLVMRNPKDTAVSYYHFAKPYQYHKDWATWDGFLNSFMSEDMPGRSWFNYNLSYWNHRNDKNFFFTTYEDMKMDVRSIIEEVADFLGHPADDKTLDKLVNVADYSTMNKKYDGRLPVGSVPEPVRNAIPFPILRKGQVGDWKNMFTVEQNETFDKFYAKQMNGSSLKSRIKFEI